MTNWDAQVAMFVRRPALSAASRSDWPLTSFSSRQRHARNTFGHIDVVAANAGIGEPDRARFLDLRKGPDGEPTVSRAGIPCSQPGVFPVSSDKRVRGAETDDADRQRQLYRRRLQ